MATHRDHGRAPTQRSLRAQLLGDVLGTVTGTTGALVNGVGNTVGTAVSGVTNTVGNLVTPIVSPIVTPIISPIVTPIIAPIVPPATTTAKPPATAAPAPAPAPGPKTTAPATAPAPPPSVTKTSAPGASETTQAPSPIEDPDATPTPGEPSVIPEITAGSLDVGGKTHAFSVTDATNDTGSTTSSTTSASFVNTKSDSTTSKSNYSPLSSSSSSSSSSSRDKDGNGASSVRTLTGVGMSFGVAATLVVVVALIIYVRKRRSDVQSKYKSDTFDPAEFDSHRSDLDTAGSSYMTGNLTSVAGVSYVASSSAWDDEELLVHRIPLASVIKGEIVSSGGFGEVYRGKFQDEDVAIKALLPSKRKDMEEIKYFQAEIKLMAVLEHPRIVRFIGVAWESLGDLCVVTEFMAGGDLTALLASFEAASPPRARGFDLEKIKIALHIAHALMYLHSLQPAVIHRDLKSKNVLLDTEWNAKLTDFGVSREQADETMTAGIGSSLWMAPEVTLGERYDEKADMFSFGVMLSELDTQLLPYSHARLEGQSEMIPTTTVLQLVSLGVMTIKLTESPLYTDMQQLARQCVALDPKDRPTAADALHRIHVTWTAALEDQSVSL